MVKQFKITEYADGYRYFLTYRPEFMINGQYTDDGQFKMIESILTLSVEEGKQLFLKKHGAEIPSGSEAEDPADKVGCQKAASALVFVLAPGAVLIIRKR